MAPQRYTFRVTSATPIAGPAGQVDCWVVKTDFNRPGSESTFWLCKGQPAHAASEKPFAGRPSDGKDADRLVK